MSKYEKSVSEQKFMALDIKKRDRILNAAMSEFRYGYKKASTDVIVRKAGISKGLLFHYFGTKENLYRFLVGYAMDIMQADYFDMINHEQQDILESIWQMALLKKDISDRYPPIYNFMFGIHAHIKDSPNPEEISAIYSRKNRDMAQDMFNHCDTSLFRDDIDAKKAFYLICGALGQLFDTYETQAISWYDGEIQSYECFLEELRGYIDIFRLCFYRNS